MIATLLASRVRLTRRAWFARPRRGQWARHPLVAAAVTLWLAGFVLTGMRALFAALDAAGAGAPEMAAALALVLSGALAALLVFDVDDAVRALVGDNDLELLRRTPLSPRVLLGLKMLDAAPRSLLPLLALALPALVAFAERTAAPPAFAGVAVAVLAAVWAIPLATGSAVSLVILRLAPPRHAREALALLSTLSLTLLWIAGAVLLPRAVASDGHALATMRASLGRAIEGWSPAAVAARALLGAARGDGVAIGAELGVLAGMTLFAVLLVAVPAARVLPAVLERLTVGSDGGGPPAARVTARTSRRFAWRTASVAGAIVRRDGRMLRRSWTLLGDLVVAAALWALLPLAGAARFELGPLWLSRLMLLAVAVGLGYEIAARSIPFERHAGHWARLAPAPPSQWLAGKWFGAAFVALPLVLVVAGVLAGLGVFKPGQWWPTGCLTAAALMLSLATGAWAGATFGDPEWVNPRAMLGLTGRLTASLALLAQLALWLAVAALFETRAVAGGPLAWGLVPILAAGLGMIPLTLAARRLGGERWRTGTSH